MCLGKVTFLFGIFATKKEIFHRSVLIFSCRAGGTGAFYHVIDAFYLESLGQIDSRDVDMLEAKRLVAAFAIEVGVHVVDRTVAFAGADFVFERTASVFNRMDDVMREEEGQCPKDGRFVYRFQPDTQIRQRHRRVGLYQGPED